MVTLRCFGLTLFLALFCFVFSDAQNVLTFENYSVENGLSDFTVNCIYQDSYGFLWIGTSKGLNRFDSYKIEKINLAQYEQINKVNKVYTVYEDEQKDLLIGTDNGLYKYKRSSNAFCLICGKDSASNTLNLSNYAMRSIIKDKNGNLWIGTFEGLNRITSDSTVVVYKKNKDSNSINANSITQLFLDSKNNLFIGTSDGFAVYNPIMDNFERFYHYQNNEISSPEQKSITSFEEGPGNTIYIGSWGLGLYEFDLGTKKFVKNFTHNTAKKNWLSGNTIFALKLDNNGHLWIGTENGGLNKFDRQEKVFTVHKHEDYFVNSIAGNTVRCITADNHDDLWMGTYMGGISKLDFNKIMLNHYQHLYSNTNSLSNNKVTAFVERNKNDIWIGTDGGGINRFNPSTGQFKQFLYDKQDKNTIRTNVVIALAEIKDGHIWAGTYNEGINILNTNGKLVGWHKMDLNDSLTLSGNNISRIFQDSHDRIWAGVTYDIPCLYTGNEKYRRISYPSTSNHAIRDVRDFLEDKQGNIWMGSNGYLYRLDSLSNHFFHFTKFSIIEGSNDNYITTISSLEQDRNGMIWVGTLGKGLIQFDPNTGVSREFSVEHGLPTNNIVGLTLYDDGSLWASTDKGIIQTNALMPNDRNELVLKSYDFHDGLQGDVFNIGATLKTSDGMLMFGGNRGFNAFYPWKIQKNIQVPPVYITDLQVNHKMIDKNSEILEGKSISSSERITLDYKENTIGLYFTAVDFKNSDKIVYKYMLKGFEDQWNYAGSERKATYTNLSPGTYTFQVQAANNDDIWNLEGASLTIKVSSPWWLTYWSLILYVLTVTSVILFFRKYLLIKERKRNELKLNRIQTEKMQELNELKLQFFTNISHEIRTPLTLILGPVQELLERWKYEPKQKLQLDLILRNTKRLFHLVDQLMDFRKLENKSLPFQPIIGDIVSFIKIIHGDFKHLAVNKNITYTFESTHDNYSMDFDNDKIQKVINNLLTNAFKFTPENGTIAVILSIDVTNQEFLIEIYDDGIGIEEKHIDKIFNPFYQAHGQFFKKFKGTGVGLSLCKSLVEIMNGKIEVQSSTNEKIKNGFNTVFRVSCPIVNEATLGQELKESVSTESAVESTDLIIDTGETDVVYQAAELPTILVVEDNPDVKVFIKSHLNYQYNFVFALHGRDGLEKARDVLPDIIISDIIMPEMDGIEMCEKLKSIPETSHIPIVMLTAKNAERSVMEGLNTGVDAYLTKPFNINVLSLYLKNILHAREKLQERYRSNYSLTLKEYSNITDKEFIEKVIGKIKENLSELEFGVDELAKEVGMSRTNFYKKIKILTGLTVNGFIKNLKLKIAANLLLNSDYNINEVAYQIGFKDASYFSRCFKETFGKLPKEFMMEQQNKQ